MRGDGLGANVIEKKRERENSVSPRQHMRIQYTHASGHVWGHHAHTLHATFDHPLFITSALCSLTSGHTPRRLWSVFFFPFSICTTVIFFTPPKEWAMGRKALLLSLHFIYCPRQNRISGTTAQFSRSWKETGTKSFLHTTKQHCSLFSVTAHKERVLSVCGRHSVDLSIHSPQMLTLFVVG